jgi:hypothetical protein
MPNNSTANEEISLKELVILVSSYIKELLKYWWIFIIVGPLCAGLFYLKTTFDDVNYTSKLTFMMDSDSGPSLGAVAGLLGSFGLGGPAGDSNLDKMIKLMKSRTITKEALFKKIKIGDDTKEDFFANHIMRTEEIEVFIDEEETERFFFTRSDFGKYDKLENKALLKVFKHVVGSPDKIGAMLLSKDDLSGIVTLESTFLSQGLAIEYPEAHFHVVEKYFIEKTIEKSQATYDIVKIKYDSITNLISSKEYQFANELDRGRGLFLQTDQMTSQQIRKDLMILYEQYGELVKNKEISEYSLLTITPVVQGIDLPIYPLEPNEFSWILAILVGGFLGGVMTAGAIITRKIYRDTMDGEG